MTWRDRLYVAKCFKCSKYLSTNCLSAWIITQVRPGHSTCAVSCHVSHTMEKVTRSASQEQFSCKTTIIKHETFGEAYKLEGRLHADVVDGYRVSATSARAWFAFSDTSDVLPEEGWVARAWYKILPLQVPRYCRIRVSTHGFPVFRTRASFIVRRQEINEIRHAKTAMLVKL